MNNSPILTADRAYMEPPSIVRTSDQVDPKSQGLGKALPNKQFLSFPARENLKNVQVS